MKNNQAILNTETKRIEFLFKDKKYYVDLSEGDLHDSWNTIQDIETGILYDVNFSWEDSKYQKKPLFSVYGSLDADDRGFHATNLADQTPIKIIKIIGDKDTYFAEVRKNYKQNTYREEFNRYWFSGGEEELESLYGKKITEEILQRMPSYPNKENAYSEALYEVSFNHFLSNILKQTTI